MGLICQSSRCSSVHTATLLLQEALFWDLCLISDVRIAEVSNNPYMYSNNVIVRVYIMNETFYYCKSILLLLQCTVCLCNF